MSELSLNVELREKPGKGINRRLRSAGRVPAVVYGKGMTAVPVSLDVKELIQAISGEGGRNHILTLKGAAPLAGQPVIVADILRDRMKGFPLHVDLHKITMSEKVKVKVKVNLVGTAVGVREGGFLDFAAHELDVECLPNQIPEHLDADITALTIGHTLHVSDVVPPAGVTILDDPNAPVVSILGRKSADISAEEPAV